MSVGPVYTNPSPRDLKGNPIPEAARPSGFNHEDAERMLRETEMVAPGTEILFSEREKLLRVLDALVKQGVLKRP